MTYQTREQAIEAALRRQTAAQCDAGRHVRATGCPHVPTSPWVRRATETRDLPPDAHGARAFVR